MNKVFGRHRKGDSFAEQRQKNILAFKMEKIKNKNVTLACKLPEIQYFESHTHLFINVIYNQKNDLSRSNEKLSPR